MKKIILAVFSVCLILLSVNSYAAETLNEWERGVFQEIVEKWHNMLYAKGGNWHPETEDFDRIYQEVVGKYNISVDEVKSVFSGCTRSNISLRMRCGFNSVPFYN